VKDQMAVAKGVHDGWQELFKQTHHEFVKKSRQLCGHCMGCDFILM